MIYPIKRNFLKTVLILVPLGIDNLTSHLSPVLGQYGINVTEFLSKINTSIEFLDEDVIVRVFVDIFSNSTYQCRVEVLNYEVLVRYYVEKENSFLFLERCKTSMLFSMINQKVLSESFLNLQGYINSYNQ